MRHRRNFSPPNRPDQREILRMALADAIQYRDPPQDCAVCDALGDLCQSCAATLTHASAYLNLSRELGLKPLQA